MKSGTIPAYNSKYYSLLPYLSQLRQKQNLTEISDMELCFNFLYGIMALRMKNAEITPETLKVKDEISKFMVLLNKFYLQYVNGELQLEEE